jgi:hypothetical protein
MDGGEWSNGGMILTGEPEVLGEKHYTVWVVDGWVSMEQWWKYNDRGSPCMAGTEVAIFGRTMRPLRATKET